MYVYPVSIVNPPSFTVTDVTAFGDIPNKITGKRAKKNILFFVAFSSSFLSFVKDKTKDISSGGTKLKTISPILTKNKDHLGLEIATNCNNNHKLKIRDIKPK